jgi:N-acyl-D-aspartate/D-glutamate deacylase
MANVLFTNIRVIDGSGAQPFPGEVLVEGNRIVRVARGARAIQM